VPFSPLSVVRTRRRRCSTRLSRSRGPSTTRLLALAPNNRGDVALTLGDWDTAGDGFEESLAPLHRVGDEVNVARSLFNLGVADLERGRSAEAREHLAESAERCLAVDDKEDIAWCLVAFAAVHAQEGDHELPARLLGAAERLLSGMGATLKPYEQRLSERVERARAPRSGGPDTTRYERREPRIPSTRR
jgi:tetratricopeptide (TPR) repeat protein